MYMPEATAKRRSILMIGFGVALLGLLAWGYIHQDGPPADFRAHLYSNGRLLLVALCFASGAFRLFPNRVRSRVTMVVFSVYSTAWDIGGTHGVIISSLM